MLDIASEVAGDGVYNGKSLSERLTGRFYTPNQLADDLAEQMVGAAEFSGLKSVSATDPFCGDGRLVIALLRAASNHEMLSRLPWRIELRDREAAAVTEAVGRVRAAAKRLGISTRITAVVGDTFTSDISAHFNFVITNPPWELMKPDSRELAHFTAGEAESYRARLRETSLRLDTRFPDARGEKAWGGWRTNLARCGWDLGLRIAHDGGIVGIILPATIMGDQSSMPMRRKAFERSRVIDVASYPSEARLFDRVDQPVVTLTMVVGRRPGKSVRVRTFDADRLLAAEHHISAKAGEMDARGWTIPVGPSISLASLLGKLESLPTLQSLEGSEPTDLWLGRELDETRIDEKVTFGSLYPFVKGRMINRHGVVEQPVMSVRAELCSRFHSVSRPRAVWRDVARATSRRRMIGTVIPAGWVAGNSLHVACYRDGNLMRTNALHGLLSSLVLEAQVRSRLSTGHMSLGVVRQVRVPEVTQRQTRSLARLAERSMKGEGDAERQLEVAVAKAYGLVREDMAQLLDQFPKLGEEERARLMDCSLWNGI